MGVTTKQECRVPGKKTRSILHAKAANSMRDATLFSTFSIQPTLSRTVLFFRSQVLLHRDREVQVWFWHMVRRCLSESSLSLFLFFHTCRPPVLLTKWQLPPPPPDTSRPQCWGRWHRLQQQGNHQCVIKAVQLCHQALTWLSSSRTPNPSALWRSKACHLHKPLTFNHWSVFLCKALTVQRRGPLSAPYRLLFEFNTGYVVGAVFFFL